jgi:curved DNA-binding protein CbpA
MMGCDYYEVLRITPSATFDEVHRAYRSLAMVYHPDRNPMPAAASAMAAINDAYAVLSEPARRRECDRERMKAESFDIAGPILRAAYETLLRQGWIVGESNDKTVVLERGRHAVRVSLVPRLDNVLLQKIGRQFAGFSVVMAVEVETPISLSFTTAIIDLVHSSHHGEAFPDESFRALFAPFVLQPRSGDSP